VPLPGGLTMLPVTDDLAARLDQATAGDHRISPAWLLLRQPVAALARLVSAGRRALYIVAETFGGDGTQEAIGWQDGSSGTARPEPATSRRIWSLATTLWR